MTQESRLTVRELASLDALITAAQQQGLSLSDRMIQMTEYTDTLVAVHHGIEISAPDREILQRMRELASQLEFAPTLNQLIELRGAIVQELAQG